MSKPSKKVNYTYRRLADVKNGGPGIQNVFGVVKFVRKPVRTKGTDFSQVLSITDESLQAGDKLVVTQFYKTIKQFPPVSVGDIIRFHRLQIDSVSGELKGCPSPGFSWLFVHDDVDQPTASSAAFSYSQQHKDRVLELQGWSRTQDFIQRGASLTSLSQLVPNQYCDVVCQVISTYVETADLCFVARVWDGTNCRYQVACTEKEMDKSDYGLEERAGGLTVDVWIYDNHFHHYKTIEPGQWIKLCNLHAAVPKGNQDKKTDQDCFLVPDLELILHGGTSFGRGLDYLDPDSPQVTFIRHTMDHFIAEYRQPSPPHPSAPSRKVVDDHDGGDVVAHHEPTPRTSSDHHSNKSIPQAGCSHWADGRKRRSPSTSPNVVSSTDDMVPCKRPCRAGGENREWSGHVTVSSSGSASSHHGDGPPACGTAGNTHEGVEQDNSVGSSCPDNEPHCLPSSDGSSSCQKSLRGSTQTCMLQTASVITAHQHISHTSLEAVLASPVPNKFRVLAHLVDFHPDTLDPVQFLKLMCPNCFHLRKPADDANSTPGETETSAGDGTSKPLSSITGLLGGGFANWSPEKHNGTDDSSICPKCTEGDDTVPLELIYMLRLVLQDSRGHCLVANLWRQQAINFFQGIAPEAVLKDQTKLQDIVMTLRSMRVRRGSQPPPPPKLDCCIFSCKTSEGPNFHIFDTTLV